MEKYISNLYHVTTDDIIEDNNNTPYFILSKNINIDDRTCQLNILNLETFDTVKMTVPIAANEDYMFISVIDKEFVYKFKKLNITATNLKSEIINIIKSHQIINIPNVYL